MRVAIVNRFYRPDAAITGVAAAELVRFLKAERPDLECRVFAGSASYAGGVQDGRGEDAGVCRATNTTSVIQLAWAMGGRWRRRSP